MKQKTKTALFLSRKRPGETTGKAEKRERGRKNADLGDSKVVARLSHPYKMCLQMGTWWAGARGLGVLAADTMMNDQSQFVWSE